MTRFYEPDLGADPDSPFHETLRTSSFDEAIGWIIQLRLP